MRARPGYDDAVADGVPYGAGTRKTSGFPSSADDHIEDALDLQHLLIKRPAAIVSIEMENNAMRGQDTFDKGILAVDRSQTPVLNNIMIVVLDGGLLECA